MAPRDVGSEDNVATDLSSTAAPRARTFVQAHGDTARCVIENLGQAGVRLVLIGADGALGDIVLPVPATTAEEAAKTLADLREELPKLVNGLEIADWDRETTDALRIGSTHRRRMAGPRAN